MDFTYTVKAKDGKIKKGQTVAETEKEAAKNLSSQGYFVLEIKRAKKSSFSEIEIFKKKVALKDKIIFTKELAMMIKGGLPLVDALSALKEQSENPTFAQAIDDIVSDVKGGTALSAALKKHPKIFPDLYIAVTASGEKSGKLDEVLNRLAEQLQKDYDLITKVKSAISYPVVIVSALVGIMILMVVFVIPQMKTIFEEMGVELPLPTRILLGTSDILINFWYIFIIVLVALIIGFKKFGSTKIGNNILDTIKIKIPIFGTLAKKIYMARFTRTMATLVASGLPVLEIIHTVSEVVGNSIFAKAFNKIAEDVESGVPLSQAMKKHPLFPAMIIQMVAMGEKSGNIDYVLFNLADFYDKEVETTTANLSSLIEPILILLIGGGVGVGIASVIMPMYSLVNAI